jgi:hypothetical protein
MKRRNVPTLRSAAGISFALALAASSCTKAGLRAAGEGCTSPLDCEYGLICTPGKDGAKRICSSDLTGTGGTTPVPMPQPDGASDSASASDAVTPPIDAEAEAATKPDANPDAGAADAPADANDSG